MAIKRRVARIRNAVLLTVEQRLELWLGPRGSDPVTGLPISQFGSDDLRRRAWEAHKEELTADMEGHSPWAELYYAGKLPEQIAADDWLEVGLGNDE